MKSFEYQQAQDPNEAIRLFQRDALAQPAFIAGGTNLLDLMKLEIEQPTHLIDLSPLSLKHIERTIDGGLKIGALVTNSKLAADPMVCRDYPVLARALLSGASAQLRNKATTAGNLLQRTRCPYFYQTDAQCNKRQPRSGCAAQAGEHRNLAILGCSDACIATHPSDMAVAMQVLDATIVVQSPDGQSKEIPISDFYRLPEDTPHLETCLNPGDLITHVILPPPVRAIQSYDKVRDRASYSFALVSVAAIIVHDGRQLTDVRLAFGGIGTKPWRDKNVEAMLKGTHADAQTLKNALVMLLSQARLDEQTLYKSILLQRLVPHVLQRALSYDTKAYEQMSISPVSSGVTR